MGLSLVKDPVGVECRWFRFVYKCLRPLPRATARAHAPFWFSILKGSFCQPRAKPWVGYANRDLTPHNDVPGLRPGLTEPAFQAGKSVAVHVPGPSPDPAQSRRRPTKRRFRHEMDACPLCVGYTSQGANAGNCRRKWVGRRGFWLPVASECWSKVKC